jgi:ATP-dependent helicase Lhr and Lhr-like helicase
VSLDIFELYAVFSAPPVLRVFHGATEVGHVQAQFVYLHDAAHGPLCFRLAGRAWEVAHVEWSRGVLRVRPTQSGRVPTWLGQPQVLSNALCVEMRETLQREQAESNWLTPGAAIELAALREDYSELFGSGSITLEATNDGAQWHTFAGGGINRLLAAGMSLTSGSRWVAGNLSLRCKDISLDRARAAICALCEVDWPRLALGAAQAAARGPLSKFQPCLPADAEARFLTERLLDLPGTMRFLRSGSAETTVVVRHNE